MYSEEFNYSEWDADYHQTLDQEDSFELSKGTATVFSATPPQKKQKVVSTLASQPAIDFDDALNKFISTVNTENEEKKDEFDIFGQSIATQLRKLPELNAIQFMQKMQQQLYELRVQIMNPPRSHTSTVSSSSVLPCFSSTPSSLTKMNQNQHFLQPTTLNLPLQKVRLVKTSLPISLTAAPKKLTNNLINLAMEKSDIFEENA